MPKTKVASDDTLNSRLRTGTQTFALFTSDPGRAGGGTEVSGGGYAAQTATWTVPADVTIDTIVRSETSLAADVLFAEATANWGEVTHWASRLNGVIQYYGPLAGSSADRTITVGKQVRFAAGSVKVRER